MSQASIVNHAVEASRPLFDSGGLTLTVTVPPTPIYLNGDSARIILVKCPIANQMQLRFVPVHSRSITCKVMPEPARR